METFDELVCFLSTKHIQVSEVHNPAADTWWGEQVAPTIG
jgi:hypothetical protein